MLATIYNFISIHAPPRGATSSELRRVARSRNFNSRPSARGDFRVMPGGYTPGNFNSRPSARGDHQSIFVRTAAASFQFTPLREGRHARAEGVENWRYFNSRPSARGDHSPKSAQRVYLISIHAPPRGATRCGKADMRQVQFQFTPLREGRRKHRPQHPDERDISIHAPPRGATMPSPSVTASTNFNSRPSARGDPHGTNLPNSFFISIHAPPRGATHFVSSYGSVLQFQFTPLREGRPADKANHNLPALFQFTPLREGRHAK